MAAVLMWTLVVLLAVVVLGIVVWSFQTANRLDRLHVRYDLSWQALDAALARRFHNDAVRDTLALRERRPVRWLKLGGRAPLPTYFEIAEPAQR